MDRGLSGLAKKKKKETSGVAETFRTLVYAVLIAIVIRTVAFEPFNIPSGSMLPTLLVGDYLFVSKYSYGYSKHSLPFGLGFFSGRVLEREPERGDVVVFKLPRDNSTDFIKRVVGLPGDRIQLRDGILYLQMTRGVARRDHAFPADAGTSLVVTARRGVFVEGSGQSNTSRKRFLPERTQVRYRLRR